jgi:formylglycine-generating enzyme required for sulfatase activity/serine/threonine protein kinase
MNPLIHQTLLNRYRVDAVIGRGGMAEVYKVWDRERSTYLALKLLHEDLAQDPIFIRRFQREAQNLARLQHPNIVRFYSLEQDGLILFILMDFIDGTSLRAEIMNNPRVGFIPERMLAVMRPVCAALTYAHHLGIIHCDVKPANILIHQNGTVLVSDFGIARMAEGGTTTLVGSGTPTYMAPEQARGEDPKPEIDVYALGVVLYELLTGGERPFTGATAPITGSTASKVLWEQTNQLPVTPREYNSNISLELEAIVLRCLEKDPQRRFHSTQELYRALENAIQGGVEFVPGMTNVESPIPPPIIAPSPTPAIPVSPQPPASPLDTPRKGDGQVTPRSPVGQPVVAQPPAVQPTALKPVEAGPTALQPAVQPPEPHTPPLPVGGAANQPVTPVLPAAPPARTRKPITIVLGGAALIVILLLGFLIASKMGWISSSDSPDSPAPGIGVNSPVLLPSPTSFPINEEISPPSCTAMGQGWKSPADDAILVCVPIGEFVMGSENGDLNETPVHNVFLDAFWIDQNEVTNDQFKRFAQETGYLTDAEKSGSDINWQFPSGPSSSIADLGNHPVVKISWNDAQAYCAWAGRQLPTEAQWEKAARSNDQRTYPWGNTEASASLLNVDQPGDGYERTAPVGSFPLGISPYGALDMSGNVWEWVTDWYEPDYSSADSVTNPTGPDVGENHVIRGGSWFNSSPNARTTKRDFLNPLDSDDKLGFRCVFPAP